MAVPSVSPEDRIQRQMKAILSSSSQADDSGTERSYPVAEHLDPALLLTNIPSTWHLMLEPIVCTRNGGKCLIQVLVLALERDVN